MFERGFPIPGAGGVVRSILLASALIVAACSTATEDRASSDADPPTLQSADDPGDGTEDDEVDGGADDDAQDGEGRLTASTDQGDTVDEYDDGADDGPEDGEAGSGTTASEETTDTGAASSDDGGASDVGHFQSPSGNIHCRLTTESATCTYAGNAPWEGDLPEWADGLSFDFSPPGCGSGGFVGMAVDASAAGSSDEVVRSVCAAEPILVEEPPTTLAYGGRLEAGPLSCTSTEAGVGCRHENGRGFVVSLAELSLLLGPGDDWQDPARLRATALATSDTTPIITERQTVIETSGAVCLLSDFDTLGQTVECDSVGGLIGSEWTPDGASCEGADYNGFALSVVDGVLLGPVMGCATDLSPMKDPGFERTPVSAGEIWQVGPALACGSPDGAELICWDETGDGMQLSGRELSLFYDALP